MRLLTALAALLVSACSLYAGDDVPALDASNACEPSADRNTSCRSICRADLELCDGADWTICFEECRGGIAAGAWCPGRMTP